jgi:cell division protein FtsX
MTSLFFIQNLRLGIRSFVRNGGAVFLAMVAIICIQVVLLSAVFGKALFRYGIDAIEKRVDIRISLVNAASKTQVDELVQKIETLPYITSVESLSAQNIYQDFQGRHANDFLTLQALKELGGNPFGSELVVKVDSPVSQAEFLSLLKNGDTLSVEQQSIIEDVDAIHNDVLVKRMQSFEDTAVKIGAISSLVVFVIVLVILSVVSRMFLQQYALDIQVMRTFGVGEGYIGGWLAATYTLCVIISSVITLLLGSFVVAQFDNFAGSVGVGSALATWYQTNLIPIAGFVLATSLCIIHLIVFVFLSKKLR